MCKQPPSRLLPQLVQRTGFFLIPMCLALLLCCSPNIPDSNEAAATDAPNPTAIVALRSMTASLKTGDIALKRGRGPYSYICAHLNQRDPTYSHCGIVVVKNGNAWVYHAIGGEDNPNEHLRKDVANNFFDGNFCYGYAVARLPLTAQQLQKLEPLVDSIYKTSPLFDLDFDLKTDNKLYCSEFVYKVLLAATGDSLLVRTSKGHGRKFVGIDDLYQGNGAIFIAKVDIK